jgi:hypothetical protein
MNSKAIQETITINGGWMTTILVKTDKKFLRDKILKFLLSKDIQARVFFWPTSHLGFFSMILHLEVFLIIYLADVLIYQVVII